MIAALAGHVAPQPVVADWGAPVIWPGPTGLAVIGMRPAVPADADVVRSAVLSKTPVIVVGGGRVIDGVREVLSRDCQPHDLIAAVLVMRRQRPASTGRAVKHTEPTRRELEVVTLLARGLSNREIAGQLFISEHTVRNHLGHIFGKLEVSSRTQAVVKAGEVGWLRLPG